MEASCQDVSKKKNTENKGVQILLTSLEFRKSQTYKQRQVLCLDRTGIKHKTDTLDARTGLMKSAGLDWKKSGRLIQLLKSPVAAQGAAPHALSHLHAYLHACGSGVVHAGAVVIVGGIDIGLLILASLQSGTSPAQDHLAAQEQKKKK